jgi:hypothetical protein
VLVISRLIRRARAHAEDDKGVALVAVVVVMLVGFIIASTIAASVLFTMQANSNNRSTTQSFIAAESGRDAAVASLTRAITPAGAFTCPGTTGSGTSPIYAYQIAATSSSTRPSAYTDAGVTPGCPGASSAFVVIRSTGTGPNGSTSTIDSVYSWLHVSHVAAGGTMAYFDGSFHTVGSGSAYNGDLVVRSGNFNCSNADTVNGDLWVVGGADGTVGGNVTLSSGCVVTGSIYAAGTVSSSSQPVTIGGDIVAKGGITLDGNQMTIGGNVQSGGTVALKSTGPTVGVIGTSGVPTTGNVIASAQIIVPPSTPATLPVPGWNIMGTLQTGAATPTFTPPLNSSQNGGSTSGTVYGMTNWIEIGATTTWGGNPTVIPCPSNPTAALSAATGSVILDYTGATCNQTNGKTNVTLTAGNVPHDAAILVRPGYQMNITINGALTGPSSPASQLFLVHQDANIADTAPTCGNGNQSDTLTITSGATTIAPHIMVYSPCGLAGTFGQSFSGQPYVAGTVTFSGTFTCTPMSWTPAPLPNMACRIRGTGGAGGGTTDVYSLGGLAFQLEQ